MYGRNVAVLLARLNSTSTMAIKRQYNPLYRNLQWMTYTQRFCRVCDVPLPVGRTVKNNHARYCSQPCRKEFALLTQNEWHKQHPDYQKAYAKRRWLERRPPRKYTSCLVCSKALPDFGHSIGTCSAECSRLRKRFRDRRDDQKPLRKLKHKAHRIAWYIRNRERINEKNRLEALARPPKIKICAVCNAQFVGTKTKYCSKDCYKSESRRQLDLKFPLIQRYCKDCSQPTRMQRTGSGHRTYCAMCKKKRNRENSHEAIRKRRIIIKAARDLGLIDNAKKHKETIHFTAMRQLGLI